MQTLKARRSLTLLRPCSQWIAMRGERGGNGRARATTCGTAASRNCNTGQTMRAFLLIAVAGISIAIGACDQNSNSDDAAIKGENGSVTFSTNGQNFTMVASNHKNESIALAGGGLFTMKTFGGRQGVEIDGNHGEIHMKLPDFVSVYPAGNVQGTKIESVAEGADGTFLFETLDSPATVVAWYRQKSARRGFVHPISVVTGATTVFTTDADDGREALRVEATSSGSGTKVLVEWSEGN